MGRDAEECLSENPGRETGILNPQQLLQELAPVSLSVCQCSLASVGELHTGPTLVIRI